MSMTHRQLESLAGKKGGPTACTKQAVPVGTCLDLCPAGDRRIKHILIWSCAWCDEIIECEQRDELELAKGQLIHLRSYSCKTAVLPRPRRPRP